MIEYRMAQRAINRAVREELARSGEVLPLNLSTPSMIGDEAQNLIRDMRYEQSHIKMLDEKIESALENLQKGYTKMKAGWFPRIDESHALEKGIDDYYYDPEFTFLQNQKRKAEQKLSKHVAKYTQLQMDNDPNVSLTDLQQREKLYPASPEKGIPVFNAEGEFLFYRPYQEQQIHTRGFRTAIATGKGEADPQTGFFKGDQDYYAREQTTTRPVTHIIEGQEPQWDIYQDNTRRFSIVGVIENMKDVLGRNPKAKLEKSLREYLAQSENLRTERVATPLKKDPEGINTEEFLEERKALLADGFDFLESHIEFTNQYNHRDFILDIIAGNIPLEADGSIGTKGLRIAQSFAEKYGETFADMNARIDRESTFTEKKLRTLDSPRIFDNRIAATQQTEKDLLNSLGFDGFSKALDITFQKLDQANEGLKSGRINLLDEAPEDEITEAAEFKPHFDGYKPPQVVKNPPKNTISNQQDKIAFNIAKEQIEKIAENFQDNPLIAYEDMLDIARRSKNEDMLRAEIEKITGDKINKQAISKKHTKKQARDAKLQRDAMINDFVEQVTAQRIMSEDEFRKIADEKQGAFKATIDAMAQMRLLNAHGELSRMTSDGTMQGDRLVEIGKKAPAEINAAEWSEVLRYIAGQKVDEGVTGSDILDIGIR